MLSGHHLLLVQTRPQRGGGGERSWHVLEPGGPGVDAIVAGERVPPPRSPAQEKDARRALERASEVGEEYEDVEVSAEVIRARKIGAGIVEAARRYGSEAIVVGAEPPSRIRGGAVLGGIGAAKPEEIGAATEYVLMKAPCRVLLTAPPEAVVDPEPEPAAAD